MKTKRKPSLTCFSASEAALCKFSSLFSTVKEKEDAHTDPEFQPMKEDDCTFGEYRWEKVLRPLESPEPYYPSTLAPSLICAQISSLWQGWSSALPPSSQPLQLTNKWSRITSNRNSKQEEVPPHISTSTTVKHKILFFSLLGFGTSWMLLVLDFVLYVLDMTLLCHLRSRILQVQGI